VGACAAALLLGACGTVTRGTTADVTFNSAPAGAHVQTSIGLSCPATPCTFPISRKQAFVATFLLPGHEEQQIAVKTDITAAGPRASPVISSSAAWSVWRSMPAPA
jgi:hypothetical protein